MADCCCDGNIEYNEAEPHGAYDTVRYDVSNGYGIAWYKNITGGNSKSLRVNKEDGSGNIYTVHPSTGYIYQVSRNSKINWATRTTFSIQGSDHPFTTISKPTSDGGCFVLGNYFGSIGIAKLDSLGGIVHVQNLFNQAVSSRGAISVSDTSFVVSSGSIVSQQWSSITNFPMMRKYDTSGTQIWQTFYPDTIPDNNFAGQVLLTGLDTDGTTIFARWNSNNYLLPLLHAVFTFSMEGELLTQMYGDEIPEVIMGTFPGTSFLHSKIHATNLGGFAIVTGATINARTLTGSLLWTKTFNDTIEDISFNDTGECLVSLGLGGVAKLDSGGTIVYEYPEVSLSEPNVTHKVFSGDHGLEPEWAAYTGTLEFY